MVILLLALVVSYCTNAHIQVKLFSAQEVPRVDDHLNKSIDYKQWASFVS